MFQKFWVFGEIFEKTQNWQIIVLALKRPFFNFYRQTAKKLAKNTPVIRFLGLGKVPDERYGRSKTGTTKLVFAYILTKPENYYNKREML